MFERFTDRARRVVVLAQEQARMLGHDYIGSEHMLLGLCAADAGAAHVLRMHDVTYAAARSEIEASVGSGAGAPTGHIPFTADAKKAMEGALKECAQLGHHEVRAEHLLLGLLRDKKCTAAQVIAKLADDVDALKRNAIASAGGPSEAAATVSAPQLRVTMAGSMCVVCGRDLWDVDRFVRGERGAVCDACVRAGQRALDSSTARESTMPPRPFGDPPPTPEALDEIAAAYADGLSSDAVEDRNALRPFVDQAAQRNPGLTMRLVVQRVRLVDPDHAEVRFVMVVSNGMQLPMEGHAVKRDGRWLVARSTVVALLRRGGVQLPD